MSSGSAVRETTWEQSTRTLGFCLVAVLVLASVGVLLTANPAHAANFTVNSAGDAQDANLANAACDVNASAAGNQCTLRAAIQEANDTAGLDTIGFNITSGASSVKTISPNSLLPTITEALTINGYTQPGTSRNTLATGNDAVLRVQINGTNAGAGFDANGLTIAADGSTISGLVINRFEGRGIVVEGFETSGNRVVGNFIGTNASGTAALGNGDGVDIQGADDTTVGGTGSGARNVISGNRDAGIQIVGASATGNEVLGNYIGTDNNGSSDLGNAGEGVIVANASDNLIGGALSGARNVISGNGQHGVHIQRVTDTPTRNGVLGNFIGTDARGTGDLGNSGDGVRVADADDNTIGGTAAGTRNVISGNGQNGVQVRDDFSTGTPTGNSVSGNFVGTSANGNADLGNGFNGVSIFGASTTTIGGTSSAARNVISGNGNNGIFIGGSGTTDNEVQGNFIGTTSSGTGDLGNAGDGVFVNDAPGNFVGGTSSGAGNVISSNNLNGVRIISPGATDNRVEGNFIGTTSDGAGDLGNDDDGVELGGAPGNFVGGTTSGAGNIISGNGSDGVAILDGGSTGNRVEGNFIGTDVSGTQALGNSGDGVHISRAPDNTVGGTAAGARNTISGNSGTSSDGVEIFGSGATGNRVEGNRIGTNASGLDDLGNTDDGVVINGAPNNTIGGTGIEARNLISGNGGNGVTMVGSGANDNEVKANFIRVNEEDGVNISGDGNTLTDNTIFANAGDGVEVFSSGQGNSILSNRIFDNGGLGIDLLGTNGVTNNDTDDPDVGGNNLQNFPVITSATRSNATGATTISGRINSNPNQSFTIQCFLSDGDPSSHGEGQFFLGQRTLNDTNGDGVIGFSQACASTIPDVGQTVSVTATNTSGTATNTRIGDTSEFSLNRTVTSGS